MMTLWLGSTLDHFIIAQRLRKSCSHTHVPLPANSRHLVLVKGSDALRLESQPGTKPGVILTMRERLSGITD